MMADGFKSMTGFQSMSGSETLTQRCDDLSVVDIIDVSWPGGSQFMLLRLLSCSVLSLI